ncbi:MAG TPA: hypothetical protein DDY37_02175 [Legionella sp.]|nr:hypothetical protein [Legionella sp.]
MTQGPWDGVIPDSRKAHEPPNVFARVTSAVEFVADNADCFRKVIGSTPPRDSPWSEKEWKELTPVIADHETIKLLKAEITADLNMIQTSFDDDHDAFLQTAGRAASEKVGEIQGLLAEIEAELEWHQRRIQCIDEQPDGVTDIQDVWRKQAVESLEKMNDRKKELKGQLDEELPRLLAECVQLESKVIQTLEDSFTTSSVNNMKVPQDVNFLKNKMSEALDQLQGVRDMVKNIVTEVRSVFANLKNCFKRIDETIKETKECLKESKHLRETYPGPDPELTGSNSMAPP